MAMLKIAVGCDPNAASAKAALMQYLGQKGFLLTLGAMIRFMQMLQ